MKVECLRLADDTLSIRLNGQEVAILPCKSDLTAQMLERVIQDLVNRAVVPLMGKLYQHEYEVSW